jgi:predicted SPOUT superfamily RNA methylase MTH1
LYGKKLSIAIPASVVSDTPHLREKTSKIGLIGRAVAIFRVDEIIIYPDDPRFNQTADMNLIATLLTYMETPQYLRKRLFKLKPELQYAGILPPLRTPHHPLNRKMKNLKIGEYREGIVLSKTKGGVLADIGVEQPALIPNRQLPTGKRVTVKVTKVDGRVEAEQANRNEITDYWGYMVTVEKHPFGKMVKSRDFDLTIATSKHGVPFAEVSEKIAEKWRKAENILIAFGAPTQGLYEIVKHERLNLDDLVDFVVNTIPMQGTDTVRTEEALIASLAIVNCNFAFKV